MKDRLLWKLIFVLSLLLTIYSINNNLKMPVIEGNEKSNLIMCGLFLFDFFILLGSFGYAFKIKILNSIIWKITAIAYPLLIILETISDFYAGGYLVYEMITYSLFVLFLTAILVAPVIMYIDDFKATVPKS
ncbi:hypothetical protein [Pseudoalteromonas sp. S558]|uniref:hypothetical protein n=1 Tax=Pseudoalteromonas sp. S558 TaxID=2066515 RepID=UPI00110B225C|nr:hypothetical protein [Pseudoalteromonas sp. S558]TMO03329.1 hypothetical protein CWB66_11090 [Pseudoalteromonas sp. S558]